MFALGPGSGVGQGIFLSPKLSQNAIIGTILPVGSYLEGQGKGTGKHGKYISTVFGPPNVGISTRDRLILRCLISYT